MKVSDIIKNGNFEPEFPYVVRVTDKYGNIFYEYCSWMDEMDSWITSKEVQYINIVNGYGSMYSLPVMTIDVFED